MRDGKQPADMSATYLNKDAAELHDELSKQFMSATYLNKDAAELHDELSKQFMSATDLDKYAVELSKELSKQLNKHRQLRRIVEGKDFSYGNEDHFFFYYTDQLPADDYQFDAVAVKRTIIEYSQISDKYNPVSLARQILLDCQVFNDEEYAKLQEQVDAMLYYELVKQIDSNIKEGNFNDDVTQFLYKIYGDGSQFQLHKFNGLVAKFLEIDRYNDIESLASKILFSGITSSDEIDKYSKVGYGSDSNSFEDKELDEYAKAINDSNLKEEFKEMVITLKLLKKDFYCDDPVTHHRTIYAFSPDKTVPEGLEKIDFDGKKDSEKVSLYASYICDCLDKNSEDNINPALQMFELKENGEDNLNKLKSHLYHKAMLVHVGKEIYLLREDQEKLVSMIFPGKKITSVLMITKDKEGNIKWNVNNEYYDFTEDDVNKTLEYFSYKSMDKNKGEQQDAGSKVVRDHPYNTRSKAQKVQVKQEEDLGSSAGKRDGEEITSHYTRSQAQQVQVKQENLGSSAGKRKRSDSDISVEHSHYTRSQAQQVQVKKVQVKQENLGSSAGKRGDRDISLEHPHYTRSQAQQVQVKQENLGSSAGKRKRDGEEIPKELVLGHCTKRLAAEKNLAPSKGI